MKIKRLLMEQPKEVISIQKNDTIKNALGVMNQKRIGALMVKDGEKIVGIMTERDILRNIHKLQCFREDEKVESIMTPSGTFVQGDASDDMQKVMQTMTERKVRHLPIFDGEEMIGLVSIGDVIHSLLQAAEHENNLLKEYISNPY